MASGWEIAHEHSCTKRPEFSVSVNQPLLEEGSIHDFHDWRASAWLQGFKGQTASLLQAGDFKLNPALVHHFENQGS